MRGSIVCRACGRSIRACKCRGERPLAVALYLGVDPDTRKQRYTWKGGFRTVAEARSFLLEVATSPAYGSGLGPRGSLAQRLGRYMEKWVEKGACKEKEKASRRSRFKRHIEPRLAHLQLAKIAPETIETFRDSITGISSTTAMKVFEDVRMFLDDCLRLGYTSSNPCDSVRKPKRRRFISVIAKWSKEDVGRFFRACEESGDKGLLFITSYYADARQGEMLGLTWPAVDLDGQTLLFIEDLDRPAGGGAVFDATKTENADGIVLIPGWLTDRLRHLRKRHLEERLQRGFV